MIDTHCHIHDTEFFENGTVVLDRAFQAGVQTVVCIGTTAKDSQEAAAFAAEHDVWAAVAQHPHDADTFGDSEKESIRSLTDEDSVVAIGECGLDYYYNNSDKTAQEAALRWHLQLATETNLPLLFHIRSAFTEFWPIFDEYSGLRGAIHSFSATKTELDQALARNLYIAFNGIMSFTKDDKQLAALKACPLDKMLLETDAPFLTPKPFRGKVNEPKYVVEVAQRIAEIRDESWEQIAQSTTNNAKRLLNI
ncbi:TPA: TatD family deoxyribonuclease [Candidatus Saccharibacteria bacterium]|nr:TatD family deoxyribonuclease [Candidatus Saccharibacteria bacterium]HIO88063.1 TatD family deoxyribonuclease [Candidatus Saccharibacteria bacterium]